MKNVLNAILNKKDRRDFREFVVFVTNQQFGICLRNGIIQLFRAYCYQYKKGLKFRQESSMFNFLKKTQELFLADGTLVMLHRYAIAKYHFCRIRLDGDYMEEIRQPSQAEERALLVGVERLRTEPVDPEELDRVVTQAVAVIIEDLRSLAGRSAPAAESPRPAESTA